jgi:hypothetical protein
VEAKGPSLNGGSFVETTGNSATTIGRARSGAFGPSSAAVPAFWGTRPVVLSRAQIEVQESVVGYASLAEMNDLSLLTHDPSPSLSIHNARWKACPHPALELEAD